MSDFNIRYFKIYETLRGDFSYVKKNDEKFKNYKGDAYVNQTELLKYVYLNRIKIDFRITLKVTKRAGPIADGNISVCRQCLNESTANVYVLKKDGCLNKRSEFILSHRHMTKLF